jgi:selenocysteine-specific elongation factor
MYVIGTAGHVDHGKSTLVKALTGIDPDRLQEEKAREMTIDLGFAWLKLPSGKEISIVDVPGHERFIKNMLAGVGGFDAALVVIAADEGIMPQTEEHLDILKLLQIERGVIALTKCDMVDEEWLALMTEEVREKLQERLGKNGLASAPLVPVSARTGFGLKDLTKVIDQTLSETAVRTDLGKPRLPVDRVFSISGFGTVVTGTLVDGQFKVGQEVEIVPGNIKSRVRGLQMHKTKSEIAPPGNRVAVNLTGLEVGDLQRGQVVTIPGWLESSDRIDVRINLLADSPVEIEQNSRFDFFSGTTEAQAGVTVLDKAKILPGESGLLQLRLSEAVAVAKGDKFILRLPSPSQTIGGGQVIDVRPRRHKRFQEEVIQTLETLEQGTPAEILLQTLIRGEGLPRDYKTLVEQSNLDLPQVQEAANQLIQEKAAFALDNQVLIALASWQKLSDKAVALVKQFHGQFPLKRGMGREELKGKLGVASPKIFTLILNRLLEENILLQNEGKISGVVLSLPDFAVKFNPAQQKQADNLINAYQNQPYNPVSLNELGTDLNIVAALVDNGTLKKVNDGLYFLTSAYDEMVQGVLDLIAQNGKVTLAMVRDKFNSSRKPVQGLLEHLDDIKVTRRVGDERVRW